MSLPAENPSLLAPRPRLWRRVCLLGLLMLLPAAASGRVPAERGQLERIVAAHYDQDFVKKGRDFHRVVRTATLIQIALVAVAALWLALGPLGAWGAWALDATGNRAWLARGLILFLVAVGLSFLRLPFSVFRFAMARDVGLRHDSWTSFLLDWVKAAGIDWLLVVVVGVLVLGLFAALPRTWWAAAWGVVAVLTVGYVMLAPLVVDPLFNRFQRLDDPALESRLLVLSREGGVPAQEILVADASRRTHAVNAYFTGFGHTRRIVLYDTLVQGFPPDEIAMILAHEVGHWRRHHIEKGLALGLAAVLVGLWVGHWILGRAALGGYRGLDGRGDPALVVLAYAFYILISIVAVVPSNWVSRRMEAQADLTSLELTRDPDTFIRTEVRLAKENLSEVLPPAWVEFTLYTHPCNARRIRMAEEFR